MATKPTISDVAARAGVSKAAVSFALNGRPGVSQTTRDRVLQIAEELGFTPNSTARALSFRRSGNLGLVMARSHDTLGSDPFFPAFIAGVEASVAASGIFLLVRLVADEAAEEEAYRELARTKRVDGVFVTDLRVDDPRPALLDQLGLPAVTLNRAADPNTATAVCVDDGPAVREAVRHLVELGHRRIGHVGGPSTYLHAAHRRQVWADALLESGLPEGPVVEADFSAGGGAVATLDILGETEPTNRDPVRERPDGRGRDRRRQATRGTGAGSPVGGGVRRQSAIRLPERAVDHGSHRCLRLGQGCGDRLAHPRRGPAGARHLFARSTIRHPRLHRPCPSAPAQTTNPQKGDALNQRSTEIRRGPRRDEICSSRPNREGPQ